DPGIVGEVGDHAHAAAALAESLDERVEVLRVERVDEIVGQLAGGYRRHQDRTVVDHLHIRHPAAVASAVGDDDVHRAGAVPPRIGHQLRGHHADVGE